MKKSIVDILPPELVLTLMEVTELAPLSAMASAGSAVLELKLLRKT